jgi:glycosyltransferase involved in cell wall biosynthesis
MYFVIARLSTKTLLYTQSSLEKLNSFKLGIVNNGKREARFIVIYNSIVNHFPVLPEEKDYSKKGILFLGRLRKGCDLDLLCETVITLRKENYPVDVHVVGTGELDDFYRKIFGAYEGINFYGEIYDQERIAEISRNCSIGCYPGNAGLSIVHYMSLSLACLVHDNLMQHQGPEPSYMEDTIHGRMFLYGNKESFKQVLREMIEISDLRLYGKNAYLCYTTLSQPSYAQRIMAALK